MSQISLSPKQKLKRLQSVLESTLDAIQEETGLRVHIDFRLHSTGTPGFYELAAASVSHLNFARYEWDSVPHGGGYAWRASDPLSGITLYDHSMPHKPESLSDVIPALSLVEEQ